MEISLERHITFAEFQLLEIEYNKLKNENIELKIRLASMEHELSNLKRMIFGAKSERFVPQDEAQTALEFNIPPITPEPPLTETVIVTKTINKANKKKAIRQPIPAHLPRIDVVIEPENIPIGAKKIGENITEVMEFKPGKLFVIRYIRPKYLLPEEEKIITAELPSFPIPKGNAAPSLLSHIFVSKYVDHLPIYRTIQIFKRTEDVIFSESTVNGWISDCCTLMEPLYEVLKNTVLKSDYIQADETTIPVQTSEKKGSTHTGYLWVYHSPHSKVVCFEYQKSRAKTGPDEFLKNYEGTLQTDGYAAYNSFENNSSVTLLACMAHARRKFEHALDNNKPLASYALSEFQKLYEIERQARENNLSFDEIKILRQGKSVPILNSFETWLQVNSTKVLPKSPIGQAISYTQNLWKRLIRYVDDGKYLIDNNLIENSIRPVALGRKNYLFAGSHQAASRTAMIYSFFGTCKINNINPYNWLKYVLTVISDWKANKLSELLPQNFKQ